MNNRQRVVDAVVLHLFARQLQQIVDALRKIQSGEIRRNFGCRFSADLYCAFLNQIEQQRTSVKQRGVHVVGDLGEGHALLDVIQNLANLFAFMQRLSPAAVQLKDGSIRWDDFAKA